MRYFFSFLVIVLAGGCVSVKSIGRLGDLSQPVAAVVWSQDSRFLASAEINGLVRVWDVKMARELATTDGFATPRLNASTTELAFSPDDQCLAFGKRDGTVEVWSWHENRKISLQGHSHPLTAVEFSDDGKKLLTASGGLDYSANFDPKVPVYLQRQNLPTMTTLPMMIIAFDPKTGETLSRLDNQPFLRVVFSPDGQTFAGARSPTVDSPRTRHNKVISPLEIRKTADGKLIRCFPMMGLNIQFSRDGKMLLSGGDLWGVKSGKLLCSVDGRDAIMVHRDKDLLIMNEVYDIILGDYLKPELINIRTGWRRGGGSYLLGADRGFARALGNHNNFSPDGRLAVDRRLRLWRVPQ